MTDDPRASTAPLADQLTEDLARLDTELREIEMLVAQAQDEATRHETRRVAGEERLAAIPENDMAARAEAAGALVTLTKRADLMSTQVEVLEGKRRTLTRYREAVTAYLDAAGVAVAGPAPDAGSGAEGDGRAIDSRAVLSAQEDLRRDIARAMHDGPAQSLTNIVLQAQIVERLVERDPAAAAVEVKNLTAMVQQTLDATKSFIFDVRPMVLDDLGLVPTLRRAINERGRRTSIPVEFESTGHDQRLTTDLESGFFRIIDEAVAAYLAGGPDNVAVNLTWGREQLEATVVANHEYVAAERAEDAVPVPSEVAADVPAALASMIEDRIADERSAVAAARQAAIVRLPDAVWDEIKARARALGITATLEAAGSALILSADIAQAG